MANIWCSNNVDSYRDNMCVGSNLIGYNVEYMASWGLNVLTFQLEIKKINSTNITNWHTSPICHIHCHRAFLIKNMLRILDENYATIEPTMPKYRALCVFTMEAANLAFKYGTVDFVYAMNEKTGEFAKCNSLADVDEFLNAL